MLATGAKNSLLSCCGRRVTIVATRCGMVARLRRENQMRPTGTTESTSRANARCSATETPRLEAGRRTTPPAAHLGATTRVARIGAALSVCMLVKTALGPLRCLQPFETADKCFHGMLQGDWRAGQACGDIAGVSQAVRCLCSWGCKQRLPSIHPHAARTAG